MTGASFDRFQIEHLPAYIDHTCLKPDAAEKELEKLCREALEFGFHSVCVNPRWVSFCFDLLKGTPVSVCTVCGFPLGASSTRVKAYEAAEAVENGASEIDMVISLGDLKGGRPQAVLEDIREVVRAAGGRIVKVILETGFLSDEEKRLACRLAEEAGAHFVKTSTGFGPGGATVEDVRLMRESVSDHVGVKASGGLRTLERALAMIENGANRLGTSSAVAIMNGLTGNAAY